MATDRSKDTDDPHKRSAQNAVDRASSVTPLDDDENLDPAEVRETVLRKQQAEHAKAGNPQAGPGPVRAKPNQGRDRDQKDLEPTPKRIQEEIDRSPKEVAKEEAKNESAGAAIKKAGN